MSSQALWLDDALWVGTAIVQRLRSQVPALREVLQLDELDPSVGEPRQCPAAVVVFAGMQPPSQSGSVIPRVTTVSQDWIVAVAVQSSRADQARDTKAMGVLIPPVIGALHGWVPTGQQRPLVWEPGPRPNYGRNVSFMPLQFSIQVVTA